MFSFIVIAILLVISTFLSLSHMRKVFGDAAMKEEKAIKVMLLVFCGTYAVRVVFAILLHFKEEWVITIFNNSNTLFTGMVLLLWILWDTIPITVLF